MNLLNRRRSLMSAANESILPSGYRQVEYLENTGKQYIDTGFIPDYNTGVDIIYRAIDYSSSQYILGSRVGGGTVDYALNGSQSRTDWDARFGGVISYSGVERSDHLLQSKISMTAEKGTWNLTDLDNDTTTVTTFWGRKVNATANLVLFGYNAINIHSNLRIYNCKVYDGEILVRDFIPCYRKSDKTAGLYDLVNGVFYTNGGTGEFIVGGNV